VEELLRKGRRERAEKEEETGEMKRG